MRTRSTVQDDFRTTREGTAPARRWLHVEPICAHEGFHGVSSRYDRWRGILAFVVTCERCGAELRELWREPYRPDYDPSGSNRFMAARAGRPHRA